MENSAIVNDLARDKARLLKLSKTIAKNSLSMAMLIMMMAPGKDSSKEERSQFIDDSVNDLIAPMVLSAIKEELVGDSK